VLGPRVNAGGRIGEADLGARLLATDDPEEAMALARRLDTLNTDRREIEARVREAALAQAEARGSTRRSSGPRATAGTPASSASSPAA
jgi:single-stranded-DNA-specific exonuclease